MAEQCVVIKVHLGVKRQQTAVTREHKGIDFRQRGVARLEGMVERPKEPRGLLEQRGIKPQPESDLARLERLKPHGGIDGFLQDFFRMLGSYNFNFNSTFAGGHKNGGCCCAVDHQAQVKLAFNVEPFFNQQAPHDPALGTSLRRHQALAQNLTGNGLGFRSRVDHLDAPGLASAAGVDLRFHNNRSTQARGNFAGLFRRIGHLTVGNRNSKTCQNLFGLIFVNLHSWSTL